MSVNYPAIYIFFLYITIPYYIFEILEQQLEIDCNAQIKGMQARYNFVRCKV